MRNPDDIPPPPAWMTKEALIPAIKEQTPPEYVVDHSARIRACYDPETGWNEERLNACSVGDLIRILRLTSITEDQIPKNE